MDRYRASFPKGIGGKMVDLGCGPADIPVRFARSLPGYSITAVDGSEAMVSLAQQAVIAAGVTDRVQVRRARLPMLPLPLQSFDAVVSNSLVHHMPDPFVFWNELVRLGKPGATVLIMDLFRPESPERARAIVESYAAQEAPVLKEDFYNSLCAAFTLREVRSQIRSRGLGGLVGARVRSSLRGVGSPAAGRPEDAAARSRPPTEESYLATLKRKWQISPSSTM